MPKTYYLDNNFLNQALRNTSWTPPATVYVALYIVSPGVGGGGTEVSGGSYARQLVTFAAPSNGSTASDIEVLFPIATSNWGTIVAFAFLDAPSGGNMLYFSTLSTPRVVAVSDQVRFPAGQLLCQEA